MGKLLLGIVVFILSLFAILVLGVFVEILLGTSLIVPFAIAAGMVFLFIFLISRL